MKLYFKGYCSHIAHRCQFAFALEILEVGWRTAKNLIRVIRHTTTQSHTRQDLNPSGILLYPLKEF